MIYDIINMSDSYTIVAPDLEIAAVACCVLGGGQYGFAPLEDGGERVPLFLFGGADDWFQEKFQAGVETVLSRVMKTRTAELADCLDSCVIGGLNDRREYERALALIESPESRETFRAERHDKRRSSMNNIGGRAYKMAAKLREGAVDPIEHAPQQIFAV